LRTEVVLVVARVTTRGKELERAEVDGYRISREEMPVSIE